MINRERPRTSSRGVTNLVMIAAVLPILILLFGAVVDLARVPIARSRLLQALESGAGGAESVLAASGSGVVIDEFTPAAVNLCANVVGSGDAACDQSMTGAAGAQAFFSPAVSAAYASAACTKAADEFRRSAAGLFSFAISGSASQPFTMQFAIVRIQVDPNTGAAGANPALVGVSADTCSGASFASGPPGVTVYTLAQNLVDSLRAQAPAAAGWRILGKTNKQWLPSLWLVGTGHYEMKHLFGNSSAQSDAVAEYYVRPVGTVAGIQSPDV